MQTALGQLPGRRKPRLGDVIVFIWPKDRSKDFIKRVIAVEGETIEIRNRLVFVNGHPRDDPRATWGIGVARRRRQLRALHRAARSRVCHGRQS